MMRSNGIKGKGLWSASIIAAKKGQSQTA